KKMSSQQRYDRGDIRRLNAVSVLNQLRVKGPLSRANIALELGLTRATVSNIITDLIEASMVNETEYDASRAGRPGLLLNLNPACGAMIAVDIDIDSIGLLLTNFGQTVLCREETPFNRDNSSEATLAIAATMVEKAIQLAESEGLKCLGLCVAWAGLVDREEGQLAYGPTTGWQHVPLKSTWEARFKVPVYVENEAHAGAIGAHHFGERPGVRNLIYLSLGVGLAAGVFVDGVLLRGKLGFAGQVGHTAFKDNGITCSCGQQGCWVTEIGAAAVLRKLTEAGVEISNGNTSSDEWVDSVLQKAEAGDTVVLNVLSVVGEQIGVGLARLVQTFNPSTVVVGGRLSDLMKYVEPVIREATLRETLSYMADPLELTVGTSGDDALRGCIATVFDSVMKNPKIGEFAAH
ncbi:MAG: ROK family transcriptional regulator, partial [Lentimonas sp.]